MTSMLILYKSKNQKINKSVKRKRKSIENLKKKSVYIVNNLNERSMDWQKDLKLYILTT